MRRESQSHEVVWLAIAVLFLAGGVYWFRRPTQIKTARTNTSVSLSPNIPASTLLLQAFQAGNTKEYSGIIDSAVFVNGEWRNSSARIAKAPDRLTLHFYSGENNGLECGYNHNWMWRKRPDTLLHPYAKLNDGFTRENEKRLQLLLHNYQITWKGTATLFQHATELVEITPRFPMRNATGPAKRIWIDRATKLPLRIETFNYQMMPVMQSTLRDFILSPQPAVSFVTDESIKAALIQTPWTAYQMGKNFDEAGRISGVLPPTPTYLPPGFVREGVGLHRCATSVASRNPCFASLSRYSDGMNSLTLFALNSNCAHELQLSRGQDKKRLPIEQTHVFGPGAVGTHATKAGTIVAVADFPPDELRRVLHSTEVRPYSAASELNGSTNATSN